jgi:hypothetical protein
MSSPGIDAIYHYLSLLVAERANEKPILVRQVLPAVQYKFPDFTLSRHGLEDILEFVRKGSKAGYFTLVETGDPLTAYLMTGTRRNTAKSQTSLMSSSETGKLRWMTATMEALMRADRGDQILVALRDVNWQSPEFDDFLNVEERTLQRYTDRGKLRRLREFLTMLRDDGEAQAITNWKTSRIMLKMPAIPPNPPDAARAHGLIWAFLQGQANLTTTPPDLINPMFFAVLIFLREQLQREKKWDAVAGLDILEAEARVAKGISASQTQMKRSLLTARSGQTSNTADFADAAIMALVSMLRKEAGIRTTMLDPTPLYRGFVETPSLDVSFQYLENRSTLVEDDGLLNWLDAEITRNVAAGTYDTLRNLANKSAIVIGARQHGLGSIKQQPTQLRNIYQTVLEGIETLKLVFAYLKQPTNVKAVEYLRQNPALMNEDVVGPVLDEQLHKMAAAGNISAFRTLSERVLLWQKIEGLGFDDGVRQYEREFVPRSDNSIQAEMGILLLARTKDFTDRYDILEHYPAAGTEEGLRMIEGMLEMLAFQGADREEYVRHHEVKHMIERCLRVGIDQALAEMLKQ